jgi:hypothetical protein
VTGAAGTYLRELVVVVDAVFDGLFFFGNAAFALVGCATRSFGGGRGSKA